MTGLIGVIQTVIKNYLDMTLPELLMRQELLQKSVYRQFRMNRSEKHGSI